MKKLRKIEPKDLSNYVGEQIVIRADDGSESSGILEQTPIQFVGSHVPSIPGYLAFDEIEIFVIDAEEN